MKLGSATGLAGRWWRTPGAGRPVVFLHGLLGSHRNMATLAQSIATERSALSIDLRNHGDSQHRSANSISDHASEVGVLLAEEVQEPAHLVGHSFGGRVAIETALRFPERVSSLFVLDISPDSWSEERVRASSVFRILQGLVEIDLERGRAATLASLRAIAPDEALFAFLRTNLREDAAKRLSWRCNLPVIHSTYAANCRFEFSSAGFPTAPSLIYGLRSEFVDTAGLAAFSRLFPAFNTARHAHGLDAGHWLHGERPSEVLELLRTHLRVAEGPGT